MGDLSTNIVPFDLDIERAIEEGKQLSPCQVERVTWSPGSNRLVVDFSRGVTLQLDPARLSELAGASSEQLGRVEVLPGGLALSWPELNVDLHLPGLLVDLFGPGVWMSEMGKRGRGRTSEAKSRAARRNGTRGGRPRKHPE
jgi:hypothetical protein